MPLRVHSLWWIPLGCILVGCTFGPPKRINITTDLDNPNEARIKQLQTENASLRDDKTILTARLDEQLERERRLAREVKRLRFVRIKQDEQIRALADAPVERDKYQAQCRQLSATVSKLEKRIATLEALIAQLRTAKSSATPSAR